MTTAWMLVGGPCHGEWAPPSAKPIARHAVGMHPAWIMDGDATAPPVITNPPKPVLYYPHRIKAPGWKFRMPVFLEAHLFGGGRIEPGLVMPGGVIGEVAEAARPCRWCYAQPWGDLETCDRPRCINAWSAVQALSWLTPDDIGHFGTDMT
jgi:hypothetical protein